MVLDSRDFDFMWGVCGFIGNVVGVDTDTVHTRLTHFVHSQRPDPRYERDEEGIPKIDERVKELIGPLEQFDTFTPAAQEYIEEILRDAWHGRKDKTLIDAVIFVSALMERGFVRICEQDEQDDELCPACGSDRFIIGDGSADCFACVYSADGPTSEEVQASIDELEKDGRVEWTGELVRTRDGTLQKAWRAVEKKQLH